MKKILIAILIAPFSIEAKELSVEQELKLLNYKRKISIYNQIRYKRLLKYFAKIDREKAIEKAKSVVSEDIENIKLSHKNRKVIYIVKTPNYKVVVNALDGTIIEKRRVD